MSVCVCYQCQLMSTVGVNGYVIMSVGISSVSVGATNVDWCGIMSVGNCHQCQLVSLMLTGVS